MVKLRAFNVALDKLLKENYPLPITHANVTELSHYVAVIKTTDYLIPFDITLDGRILEGKFTSAVIQQVKMRGFKQMTWANYIKFVVSLFPVTRNPCIYDRFMLLCVRFKYLIDEYCIDHFVVDWRGQQTKLTNVYIKPPPGMQLKHNVTDPDFVGHDNHFLLSSMIVMGDNGGQITAELQRLLAKRDDYDEIHFHLNNNGGGHTFALGFILLCLCGGREQWMKPSSIKRNRLNSTHTFDMWTNDYYDGMGFSLADIYNLNQYKKKYKGRVYVYMSHNNYSAAFFFITYLVYAFGGMPRRYTKDCYGKQIKFGTIAKNAQLVLIGTTNTCSGDGDAESFNAAGIRVIIPTHQHIASSIQPQDWNRFWTENK